MQSCIWSCRSWPLNPCEAAWQAKRFPVGTGTAAAGLTGTAGVDVAAGVGVAAGVVDCAKAAAATTSEAAATMALNGSLMGCLRLNGIKLGIQAEWVVNAMRAKAAGKYVRKGLKNGQLNANWSA